MTYHSLEEIYAEKSLALRHLHEHIQELRVSQAHFHPSNAGWSIAEIAEHLSIVDGQLIQLIAALLKKIEESGAIRSAIVPLEISLESLAQKHQSEKFITRDKFRPTGKMTIPESLTSLRDFQSRLYDLKPRLQSADLTMATFPHWVFGPLNLGQWLAFIGIHERRHLVQIQSILTSPEFADIQN